MCKIITISTQKGGVGKTTTAISLSAALHERGEKVLLVDMDPQANATIGTGIITDNKSMTIADIMLSDINGALRMSDIRSAIRSDKGFDIIPSNIALANLELTLVSVIGREGVLRRVLEPVKQDYDYIIIDTLPSLGILVINAFAVSDYVVIPIMAKDYYSLQGFDALVSSITQIQRCINPKIQKLGEVITMFDGRNNNDKQIYKMVCDDLRTNVFDTVIPISTKAAEAGRLGKTIMEYDPKGKVALAYRSLVDEMISRLKL